MNRFLVTLLSLSVLVGFTGCEFCETRGTITFDNTRLWCNCEIDFPNGDEYVIFAGESKTYEFFRGTHTFTINCGETAHENDWTCYFENGVRDVSFDVDCADQIYFDLDF